MRDQLVQNLSMRTRRDGWIGLNLPGFTWITKKKVQYQVSRCSKEEGLFDERTCEIEKYKWHKIVKD